MPNLIGSNHAKNSAIHYALSMAKRPKFSEGGSPGQVQGVHSAPVTGPLIGTDGGRTDTLPISVPAGSYVIPADVVSGIPGAEGNSLAGHANLTKMFASQPFMPDKAPYGAPAVNLPKGQTIPGIRRVQHSLTRAEGGRAMGDDQWASFLRQTMPMPPPRRSDGGGAWNFSPMPVVAHRMTGGAMVPIQAHIMPPMGQHVVPHRAGGKEEAPIPILAAGGEFVVHPDVVRKLGHGSLKLGHEILDSFVKHTRKANIKTLRKLPGPVRDGTK